MISEVDGTTKRHRVVIQTEAYVKTRCGIILDVPKRQPVMSDCCERCYG